MTPRGAFSAIRTTMLHCPFPSTTAGLQHAAAMCTEILYLSANLYTYLGCTLLQAGGLKALCVLAVRAGLTSG